MYYGVWILKVLWIYIYIQGGAQSRALIKTGKLFNQKSSTARGFGRGKRLPVPETPTVEFRHLELSRVTEPATKEKDVPHPTTASPPPPTTASPPPPTTNAPPASTTRRRSHLNKNNNKSELFN